VESVSGCPLGNCGFSSRKPQPHARYAELETVDNFDFQLR
jgi:hypothetical protein